MALPTVPLENRASFFGRIARFHLVGGIEYQQIEKAYDSAKEAFRLRMRENGERYFEHARATALILIDELGITGSDALCTALLHDVIEENSEWTVERIEREFSTRIAQNVAIFTKPESTDPLYGFYHMRFWFVHRTLASIKLADRLHNMRTQGACSLLKQLRKSEENRVQYLPIARFHGVLVQEFEHELNTPPHLHIA